MVDNYLVWHSHEPEGIVPRSFKNMRSWCSFDHPNISYLHKFNFFPKKERKEIVDFMKMLFETVTWQLK